MNWKKKSLKESRLYIIIDKQTLKGKSLFNAVNIIKDLGVDIIQYRDKVSSKEDILKDSLELKKLLLKRKTIFIINDYLDIAAIIDSDGIHLGQNDVSLGIARKILGKEKIIGISCHNLKEILQAQDEGADYISIGPIFPTPLKPKFKAIGLGLIRQYKDKIRIPFFAIGGINKDNVTRVLSAGAKRVAICRAISQAEDINDTIRKR